MYYTLKSQLIVLNTAQGIQFLTRRRLWKHAHLYLATSDGTECWRYRESDRYESEAL